MLTLTPTNSLWSMETNTEMYTSTIRRVGYHLLLRVPKIALACFTGTVKASGDTGRQLSSMNSHETALRTSVVWTRVSFGAPASPIPDWAVT